MKKSSVLLALTASLSASVAFAQDAGTDVASDGSVLLDTIRIESAEAQTLLGNDQITEEEIEQRNPADVGDVFRGESSVMVSGGAAIATKVFVNGIEESLLAVTIDGARQNKSAFHHTGNVLIDPALLKKVEVTKGLAPADAGPGAVGGSLAYETKDASDLLEDGDNFGGKLTLSGQDNGEHARGSLALFGRSSGWEFLVNGTGHVGDDYEAGDGNVVPGTQPELTDFLGKVSYTSDSGNKFTLSGSQTEDTGTRAAQAGPGGIFFTRPDFAGVNTTASNVYVDALSRRNSITARFEGDGFQGMFRPDALISYNEQEIDASGVYGINTSLSGYLKNEFNVWNGTITAGIDFFNETAEGEGRGPGVFGSSGEETLFDFGVFAQARQDLTDRLSVTYGARFDVQSFEGADGSDFDSSGASVNAALDYILTDTLTFNAGAASTWGGYELGEAALINFGGAWDYTGLDTSRANAVRVGLRYENGPWEANGAFFHTDIEDIAAVLPDAGARGALSDLTSTGFEASLAYKAARGFVKASLTHADVKLDGQDIGTTAYYYGRPMGTIIALEFAYDMTHEWRVGGDAEIAVEGDTNGLTLPGYEVVNAYLNYKPEWHDTLNVRLDVLNIFDETYSSRSSDGLVVPASPRTPIPLLEPGRTFRLTATLDF